MAKIKVGLIYGGCSGEHEISILSANSVMSALDKEKYEVLPIGITKKGKWLPGQSPAAIVETNRLYVRRLPDGETLTGEQEEQKMLDCTAGHLLAGLRDNLDAIFPLVHGPFGEDGTLQGLLEMADIPYVGCGVLASAVGMDKVLMKNTFAQNKLPVGLYLGMLRSDWESSREWSLKTIREEIGYPCFVKPANLGSSVGISKATNEEELIKAMDLACQYDRKVIIEKLIQGREIECSVLGNDDPTASLPGEILPSAEFYDYEAKYLRNDSQLIIPAQLSMETTFRIQDLAVKAFRAIDGSGLSRVDFFVNEETEEIYLNEINTMPGFTKVSMYPKLLEASGVNYTALVDRLIALALERYRDKKRNRVT